MTSNKEYKMDFPTWHDPTGKAISCTEKIKVLNENIEELQQMAQDAFEDALLLGCDETQIRETLQIMLQNLYNPYRVQN
jgi:hypothetical protein